jgi:AcrR family transcriptional regulator
MTSFQRAHSEEQREVRRRAILDAAAAMLAEMPVAQVTLSELSRRAGLAKSNVLRYFESREAVLLEVLNAESRDWLDGLDTELAAAVDADAMGRGGDRLADTGAAVTGGADRSAHADPPVAGRGNRPAHAEVDLAGRGDRLADALAKSLAARPVLCDLSSAQAAVLEHNVSPEAAARYKHAAVAQVSELGGLLRKRLPELSEPVATRLAALTIMVAGAVWTHSHPGAAVRTVYESDPVLSQWRMDFTSGLRDTLEVLIAGLLSRRDQAPSSS